MIKLRLAAVSLAALLVSSSAFAADNFVGKDGNAAAVTIKSKDVGSGVQLPQSSPSDALGVPFGYSAWGAAPTGNVPGVNSNILSLPALPAGSNTIGSIANISGTIALPTGAATSANQANTQGTVAAGTAGTKSDLTGCVFNSVTPSLTSGQQVASQCDSGGNLKVNIVAGGNGTIGTVTQGTAALASGAWPTYLTSGGSTLAVSNPIWTAIAQGGAILSAGNPLYSALSVNGSIVSLSNPMPIQLGTGISLATLSQGTVAAGTAATKSELVGCVYNVTPPSLGNSQQTAAQCDTSGNLKTNTTLSQGGSLLSAGNPLYDAITINGSLVGAGNPFPITMGSGATFSTAANQVETHGTVAAGTAATKSDLVGGVYNSTAPTLTTGQQAALQTDANGNLKIAIVSGGGSGGTASSYGAAFPATGTAVGGQYLASAPTLTTGNMGAFQLDVNGNLKVNVSNTNANGQQTSANSSPVVISSDQTALPIKGGAAAGAAPSGNPVQVAALSGGATGGLLQGIIQADSSVPINISTATTTQLIALSSGRKIYVTSYDAVAEGAGRIMFEYGTGTNCGTGTTILTGSYSFSANGGISKGTGLGPVLVVPAGNALCAVTSAAVLYSGSVSYAQF